MFLKLIEFSGTDISISSSRCDSGKKDLALLVPKKKFTEEFFRFRCIHRGRTKISAVFLLCEVRYYPCGLM